MNKPCMNEDCVRYNKRGFNILNCNGRLYPPNVLNCPKYLSEPKQSAWEMFRELRNRHIGKFDYHLEDYFNLKGKYAAFMCLWNLILTCDEKQAIEIMQKIKEELNGK